MERGGAGVSTASVRRLTLINIFAPALLAGSNTLPTTMPIDRPASAAIAAAREDSNSMRAHEQLVAKAKSAGERSEFRIDLYFLGDSITRRWGCTDPQWAMLFAHWQKNFFGWNAGNFGWGADRIENILWRIEHGELDDVNPKVIVLLAGTNNVGHAPGDAARVADIVAGESALIAACQAKAPGATIILTGILPRNDNERDPLAVIAEIRAINAQLAKLADGKTVRFLDVGDGLADAHGKLFDGVTIDGLHLSVKGYDVWATRLLPLLEELLGPRANQDRAPPATGDPYPEGR